MSFTEWTFLPWWEQDLLKQGWIEEQSESNNSNGGSSDSTSIDLTSADADLSGFGVRSVG